MMSVHTPFWWAEGGGNIGLTMPAIIFGKYGFLRTTFLEDRQLDLNEWTTVAKEFDGERGYNQGYDFWSFPTTKTRKCDVEMAKSRRKMALELGCCCREATNIPLEELYADWVSENTEQTAKPQDVEKRKGRKNVLAPAHGTPENAESWNTMSRREQEKSWTV